MSRFYNTLESIPDTPVATNVPASFGSTASNNNNPAQTAVNPPNDTPQKHRRMESAVSLRSVQLAASQYHAGAYNTNAMLLPTSLSLTTNEKYLFQRLILRLSKAMLAYGAPTYRVESRIEGIARSKRIPLEILCQPSHILLSFGDIGVSMTSPAGVAASSLGQSTFFIKVDQSFNMRKLQELDALARRISNAGMEIFAFGMSVAAPASVEGDNSSNSDEGSDELIAHGGVESSNKYVGGGTDKADGIAASAVIGGVREPARLVDKQQKQRLRQYDEPEGDEFDESVQVSDGGWFRLLFAVKHLVRKPRKWWRVTKASVKAVFNSFQPRHINRKPINSLEDCMEALDDIIVDSNSDPPFWQRSLANAVMAMIGAVLIFQGKWWDALISFILGLVNAILLSLGERVGLSTIEVWLSFLMSLVIQTVVLFVPDVCLGVTTLSVLMPLYPGVSITLAMLEMASRNYAAGTVRMFYSFIRSLKMGFGLSIGARMFKWMSGTDIPLTCSYPREVHWYTYLLVLPFTMAACVNLKGHYRQWPMMFAVTATGLLANRMADIPFQTDVANVLSSITIGLVANSYARRTNDIALASVLCAIMFMVPGSIGMMGFFQLLSSTGNTAGANFAIDILIRAMSIALGLYISNVIYFPMRGASKRAYGDILTL